MRLSYFSVRDYRGIVKAGLKDLHASTILIGPNNEGKSTILQGLHACLGLLREARLLSGKDDLRMSYDEELFDWSIDYPIRKQGDPDGESVFELSFELIPSENEIFRQVTGSYLNGVLPIELRFGPKFATFKVLKQGRGGSALSKKRDKICSFISQTLDFVYIPAVRTAESSLSLIGEMVSRELRKLKKDARYSQLLDELVKLQKPVLHSLSTKVKQDLQKFLGPTLQNVELNFHERLRLRSPVNDLKIVIDDGTPTVLERKGDGVQSLVAISLMSSALRDTGLDKDVILLLEEPESHLHPNAIHQLRDVLDQLRHETQIIMTTHCPLFVDRAKVTANCIVANSNVRPATSLADIRQVLGIRASDNLQHAALIIVVEGNEDRISLDALLSHHSSVLAEALRTGALTFETLGGASKLPYALSLLRALVCNYFVVLDNDDEGQKAFREAQTSLLLTHANVCFTNCLELKQSELEDLFDANLYVKYFTNEYGVDIKRSPFAEKRKWSERIRFGMTKSGKQWTEQLEYKDKHKIAEMVKANPAGAIHPSRMEIFTNLTKSLEEMLLHLGPNG